MSLTEPGNASEERPALSQQATFEKLRADKEILDNRRSSAETTRGAELIQAEQVTRHKMDAEAQKVLREVRIKDLTAQKKTAEKRQVKARKNLKAQADKLKRLVAELTDVDSEL